MRHSVYRSKLLRLAILCLLPVLGSETAAVAQGAERPNVLWITIEDTSPLLGSYGDLYAHTPNLDRLASQGVRYLNAFSVAGVCAPSRSAIITGVYPTSLGTHNMRTTGRLPEEIRAFPEYLRAAGYYTSNNVKTDYNFEHAPATWDELSTKAHWRNRKDASQPFFSVFNFTTTHESRFTSDTPEVYEESVAALPKALHQDPAKLVLPPYYPDTPATRENWAHVYNTIAAVDLQVGEVLRQLEEDGLAEKTIVFFYADHGTGLPRGKRWLYDSGIRVPLIIRTPAAFRAGGQGVPGSKREELVSLLDLAPTMLRLVGREVPGHMQGRAFLGAGLGAPREYVYAIGGRQDERYDMIRAVRDGRYKYIRNYESFKPYYQWLNTNEKNVTMQELRRLHAAKGLPPLAAQFAAATRPPEELYDTWADRHEVFNLAARPEYREQLERLRAEHLRWLADTRDVGLLPEADMFARQAEAAVPIYTLARRGELPLARVREAAVLWEKGPGATPELMAALRDEDSGVRYWAAVGLGNLRGSASTARPALLRALEDPSPVVRIAGARALARHGSPEAGLSVLRAELRSPHEWVRLSATHVLDDIGEAARPAIPELRGVMDDANKYVVRVANHTLNTLLGTGNEVP